MDIGEILIEGDGSVVVMWRGKIGVRVLPLTGEMERRSQKVMKSQWRGHQKSEDKIDLVALRDFYCEEIVRDVDGLTKDGQPFGKTVADRCALWDRTPDFRAFVIQAASDVANFEREKND